MKRWVFLLLLIPAAAYAHDQYGPTAWRSLKALYSDGNVCVTGPCDLAAGTTIDGAAIGSGVSDGDKGDITVSGSGATWRLDNCTLENDSTPIPDSCVGDGTDGGGGGNSVEVSLALSGGAGFFSTTVTGQTWVASGSEIVCTPFGTTADGLTPEAIAVSNLNLSVSDKVAGTGFNLNVYSPNGLEGTIRAHCVGV